MLKRYSSLLLQLLLHPQPHDAVQLSHVRRRNKHVGDNQSNVGTMVVSNDSSSSGEEREALEVTPAPEVTPTPTPVTPLPHPASMETILARLALQEAA
ncbi:hypothetical protein YC2023_011253 [Brassica napus]